MSQEMIARSETAALEDIVQNQKHSHDDYHGIYEVRSCIISCNELTQLITPSEYQIKNDTYTKS